MALVITIAGVDRTAVVEADTIRITQLADSFTFTANLTVFDVNADITIVVGSHLAEDEITMVDGATTFFGGYVANQDITTREDGSRELKLQCQGYGILLTETLIESGTYAATADDAIINDLFDSYLDLIDSVTEVAELDASMDLSFSEKTLAEVMGIICKLTSGRFYVDNTKKLHYFSDEADDSPFGLSDEPDQAETFSYLVPTEKRTDASQIVNRARVVGPLSAATRNNTGEAGSQETYGIRGAIVSDSSLTDPADLNDRGDAILDRHAWPVDTYVVRTLKDGAFAGQRIEYTNPILDVDDFLTIRELFITWDHGRPIYEMVLGEVEQFSLQRASQVQSQLRAVVLGHKPLVERGWAHDLTFSATDTNTVAWGAGAINISGGVGTFDIDAGNTGNIAAVTYIYLDTDESLSTLQVTATAADAIGANKILIAVAKNVGAGDCEYQVFGGEELGSSYLFSGDALAPALVAGVLGASSLLVSQANTAIDTIRNLHVSNDGADRIQAVKIRITDVGGLYDATEVEAALQEIGGAPDRLVASDGDPDPAWHTDIFGNLIADETSAIALEGHALGVTLDADKDSGLEAQTDDEVDVILSGSEMATFSIAGLTIRHAVAQDYLFGPNTSNNTNFAIQGQTAGVNVGFEMFPKDGDGSDYVSLVMYGKGQPADVTNRERLIVQYQAIGTPQFRFQTEAGGTGTVRSLVFEVGANTNMIRLDNSGNVGIGAAAPGSLLELNFATEDLELVDAGSAAATEQDWIEVQVGGVTGYIRVFAAK